MSDIVEFLLARIAEDEAAARAASPGPWVYTTVESVGGGTLYDRTRVIGSLDYEQPDEHDGRIVRHLLKREADANGAHIARHDPARVLAECEAKRRIVDAETRFSTPDPAAPEHQWVGGDLELSNGSGGWVALGDADRAEFVGRWYHQVRDTATLRILAQPYVDHPDFDPAWRLE